MTLLKVPASTFSDVFAMKLIETEITNLFYLSSDFINCFVVGGATYTGCGIRPQRGYYLTKVKHKNVSEGKECPNKSGIWCPCRVGES